MIQQENVLLVIGGGLPRTGTLSTKAALEILFKQKCHHYIEAMQHQEAWFRILTEEASDEEFRNLFINNNYCATLDGPGCFFYQKSLKVFPNAKVLLNTRDPKKWVDSMKNTIMQDHLFLSFPATLFDYFHIFQDYLGLASVLTEGQKKHSDTVRMGENVRKGNGIGYFNEWVCNVENNVPSEKLLKFDVVQGWGPLCEFLDLPIPKEPFPKVNSTDDFVKRIAKRKRRSWLLLYEFVSIPILMSTVIYCKLFPIE